MPIFLIWTIIEIWIFAIFSDHFGFLLTLGGYLLPSLLGIVLLGNLKTQGITALQANLAQGSAPSKAVLHMAARAFGAILLLPPSFFLRVLAIFLITPGVNNLLVFFLRVALFKRMLTFGSGFVRAGSGGFTFYAASKNFRDVEPIDVTPIQISSKPVLEEDSSKGKN